MRPIKTIAMAAGLAGMSAAPALADVNSASANGSTQAEACNAAMSSAAIPAYGQNITEKKCDCRQEEASGAQKWSCVGFVSYTLKQHSAPVYNGVNTSPR